MRRVIERHRKLPASADDGFTMVEILVAMFLTVIVMTALLTVLVSSLKTVTQARQRQTATALATQTIERLRALPYDKLTGPDATNFPASAGLQYVTVAGTVYTFAPTAVLPGISETLVVNEHSGRWVTTTIDGVGYVVQTYVTKPAASASGQQAYNLTSIVSWSSSVNPTTTTVAERSTAYSPAGCLSTSSHPFSGPCQAYFTAQAGQSAGGFSVTNADDSTLDIPGITGTSIGVSLPGLGSSLQIEQTASGSASGLTSGARSVFGTTSNVGGVSAAASVDSDPSSTPNQSASMNVNQSSGTVSLTGATGGTLTARPSSGDSASAKAAIQADSSMCLDGNASGTALATGASGQLRPCASSSQTQSASAGGITYSSPSATSVSIMSIGAAPQASRAVAANLAATNAGACTSTALSTAPSCAHARVYRALGTLVVGDPTGSTSSPLAAGTGVFSVTGLVDQATAESGKGFSAPAYARSGTLKVWTGAAYTTVNLGSYAAPPTGTQLPSETWTIPAVTTTYAGGLTVTASGSVTVQRPTKTTSGPADCLASACVARLDGGGGLRAVTVYSVKVGATEITKFVLVSEIGGAIAESSYKAAPSG